MRTLVSKLQELITLHRKYNCRLALSEFEKVRVAAPSTVWLLYPVVARHCIIYALLPVPHLGKCHHCGVPHVRQGLGPRADPFCLREVRESLHSGTEFARGGTSFALYRGNVFCIVKCSSPIM